MILITTMWQLYQNWKDQFVHAELTLLCDFDSTLNSLLFIELCTSGSRKYRYYDASFRRIVFKFAWDMLAIDKNIHTKLSTVLSLTSDTFC